MILSHVKWELVPKTSIVCSDLNFPPSGFPGGASGKESACQCRRHKRCGFDPWVRKIPCSRKWQPSPVAWKIPWTEEPGRLWSMATKNQSWLSDLAHTAAFLFLPCNSRMVPVLHRPWENWENSKVICSDLWFRWGTPQRDWESPGNLTLKYNRIWWQDFHRARGNRGSLKAKTKSCSHQDPGERSSDSTRDWARPACRCWRSTSEAWVGSGLLQG